MVECDQICFEVLECVEVVVALKLRCYMCVIVVKLLFAFNVTGNCSGIKLTTFSVPYCGSFETKQVDALHLYFTNKYINVHRKENLVNCIK